MITYPNREHENADKAARRRAQAVLDHLGDEIRAMRQRVESDRADGDDSQRIASLARDLTQYVAILGALREIREWHALDQADAAATDPDAEDGK